MRANPNHVGEEWEGAADDSEDEDELDNVETLVSGLESTHIAE